MMGSNSGMWPAERGTAADSAHDCEEVKRNLLHLLKMQHRGTNVDSLVRCYREEFGSKLDVRKYGFDSLLDMLKTVSELRLTLDPKSDNWRVYLNDGEVCQPVPVRTQRSGGGGNRSSTVDNDGNRRLSSVLKKKTPASTSKSPQQSRCSDRDREELAISERERERQLRKKPMPRRFRNDDLWELHVCNFPYDTTEEQLMEAFERFGCTKIRLKAPADKSPFAFARFPDYAKAVDAFTELDLTEFNGRQLRICFARSSIVTEEVFRELSKNDRFNVTVNYSQQSDAGRWDTDDDDDDDADDDDVWDSGAGNDGAVAGSDASSRRDDAAVDGRGHRQRDAGDAGVVHAVKDGSGNGRRAIQNLVADAGPDNDDYLGRGCVTGGRRGSGSRTSRGGSRDGTTAAQSRDGPSESRQGAVNVSSGSRGRGGPGGRTGRCHSDADSGCHGNGDLMRPGDVVNGDVGQYGHRGSGTRDRDFADERADSGSVGNIRRENENGGRSHAGAVCGSADSRVSGCDVVVSSNKDSGNLGGQNDGNSHSAAAVCDDRGNSSLSEDTKSQLAFVRQQRMKWLEAQDRGATKQSDARSQLLTTAEQSTGSSATKSNHAVSPGRRPDKPVVSRQSDTVVSRPLTDSTTVRQRPASQTRPALTNRVGKDVEPGSQGNGVKNCADRNQVRNCSNSQIGRSAADGVDNDSSCSGRMKVTLFEATNNVSRRPTAAVETRPGDEKSRCMTASCCETVERQGTPSESQPLQQSVPDAAASASLAYASDDGHRSSETRPKPVTVAVQEDATTTAALVCSDRPLTDVRASLSTQNDVGVISSTHQSAEAPGDSAVPKTADTVSAGLHEVFDKVDSASELGAPSLEVRNSSCTTSLSLYEPLIEDEFDIYIKEDGLDFWFRGCSASESFGAQHDLVSIDPPEGFADGEDTLLKLPGCSTSENDSHKPDEVCSATETQAKHQSVRESAQSVTSDATNVERRACGVKAPRGRTTLWTCVYSREDGDEVGQVSTRFSPAFYHDAKIQNSVTVDATPGVALAEGMVISDERASENELVDSRICPPRNHQDTESACRSFDGKAPQELASSTQGQLTFISAKSCMKTTLSQNVHGKSSDNVSTSSTTEQESSSVEADASAKPIVVDTIDSLTSMSVDKLNRPCVADNQPEDTNYEIPAEMEADFIDQMYHETCPNVLRSSTEDPSSEMSLDIVITHVVDARHFWGHIVNEGIQKQSVERLLETMIALSATSDELRRVSGLYRRRAATSFQGELSRVWVLSMSSSESLVHYIDFGNQQTVLTADLVELPASMWDIPPAAVPCRLVRPDDDKLELQKRLNTRVSVRLVRRVRSDKERHIVDVEILPE